MVTFQNSIFVGGNRYYKEGFCLSTDPKPESTERVAFCNGSILLEIDTSVPFVYDEDHETWVEFGN